MTVSRVLSKFSRWPLFLAYVFFLYFSHTLPADEIPPLVAEANDKVLHFLDFFLLALLAFRTFVLSSFLFLTVSAQRGALGFSFLYALFLEWIQRGVPGREVSAADLVADGLGILAAAVIFRISKSPSQAFLD